MSISALNSALNGIHNGMNGLRKNAQEIVTATTPTRDNPQGAGAVEKPTVEMLSNEHQVAASAKVVKAEDEMLGTLLDEMA